MKDARKYTNEQLEETLDIAQKIKNVQNDETLKKKEKKQKIILLVKENKRHFFRMIFIFLHKELWTERTWAVRLALIAVIPGLAIGGSVGLATMGVGIGIPLFLLTAFGGLFIGVVIEEIEKMKNK